MNDYKKDMEICEAATPGKWFSYRMTDENTGEPITHERYLEYMTNSLKLGGKDLFFVYVEKSDGGADVCHSGNGPTSMQNAHFIAHFDPTKVKALLESIEALETELSQVKAENERLKNKMDEYLDKFNELSLQAVRYRDENERLERCRQITDKSWQKLTEENERYLSAIKTFCDRSKWAVDSWKKQDYITALFEIANKESR